MRSCAVYFAAHHAKAIAKEAIDEGLVDPSALVRETAVVCSPVLGAEAARAGAQARLGDDSPSVRRHAARLLERDPGLSARA